MPAGDDGTIFRGEAFFEIDENGNVIIETDNGSVTIDGVAYADKADDPHDLAGDAHGADTLANLNGKVSDATLDDSGDTRTPDAHGSEAHNPEVLHDGENFDGQSTSELSNLAAVETNELTALSALLTDSNPYTETVGRLVTVAGDGTHTMVDINSKAACLGGVLITDVAHLKIEVDGTTRESSFVTGDVPSGENSAGNNQGVQHIPLIMAESSLTLTAENTASSSKDIGYHFRTVDL